MSVVSNRTVQNTVSNVVITSGLSESFVRTVLSKSSSCKTMKDNATSDSRNIDLMRGNKYNANAVVLIEGVASIDVSGVIQQRVDRTKLLCQALLNLLQKNIVATKQSLTDEIIRLYNLYKDNVDISAPTAEAFDKSIAKTFGEDIKDSICMPIRTVSKSGDFSVGDISITLLGSSVGVIGSELLLSKTNLSVEQRKLLKSLTEIYVSSASIKNIAGQDTAPSVIKRGRPKKK